jgi:hypothetical protein
MKALLNFLLTLIVVAILARLSVYVLPFWWGIVPGAVLGGLMAARSGLAALAGGFFGLALLWVSYALAVHVGNHGILGNQLAGITGLPSSLVVLLITATLGGVVGAAGSLTGYLVRKSLA